MTRPQSPASPQPEAEAQKAVAWQCRRPGGSWGPPFTKQSHVEAFLADGYEIRPLGVIGPTPSASAPLPEQRQEAAQVEDDAPLMEYSAEDVAAEHVKAFERGREFERAQAVKVPLTFEEWWYGHDGVRQRQVAYLGWPCTKELAESIWNDARGIHPTEGERSHD